MEGYQIASVIGNIFSGTAIAVLITVIARRKKTESEAHKNNAAANKTRAEAEILLSDGALKQLESIRAEMVLNKAEAKAEILVLKNDLHTQLERHQRLQERFDKLLEENGKLRSDVTRMSLENEGLKRQVDVFRSEWNMRYNQQEPIKIINQPTNQPKA